MQKLPLDGIRVVDLSWAIAGPYASQWMGVLGAEIIRIESSLRPGLLRRIDIGADGKPGLNREPAFNAYNYGKKSCTLNLARPAAIALIKELIKISDVVMDNFAFGVMERLGLDYPSLRELKPDIIVLSISILGRTGPKKEYFGWGPTGLAHTGLLYMMGYPESEPKRIGGAWPDPMSSMYSAFAVLAALHHRERTGEGQFIDVSMGETVITQIPEAVMDY
ncbi:MAG: CoA transferase, partial [Anaerolineae bacterium]|nr:CoA transferase [Anaerolineae bacterium]